MWYKKMGERIWTPWFIKFIHSHSYFNIYTNFLHERSLSVSHRDTGVNYAKTAGPDSYLLEESSLDNNLLEMLPLSNLKWYDFCFREVLPDRVVRSFDELGHVLRSVQNLDTILLVNLHETSEAVTNNLLCHFERLNIRNYIFMGQNSRFLLDLARRGHPVIDVDKFFDSIMAYKSMRFPGSSLELIKEILVKAYVIKKSLEFRYSIWVSDLDMLPLREDSYLDSFDSANDFYVGSSSLKLLFVRRSTSALKIWTDNFINKIALMVDSQMNKDSGLVDDRNFVGVVGKLLESLELKGVRIKRLEVFNFGVKIDVSSVNETSLKDGKKIALWSSETGLDLVEKRFGELRLWIVDGDLSCTAVTCHQS